MRCWSTRGVKRLRRCADDTALRGRGRHRMLRTGCGRTAADSARRAGQHALGSSGPRRLHGQVLFGDVWRRTDLSPRDRSLVTVSALICAGKTAQLTGHLNRALDNGVRPFEIGGIFTHLAFCIGWPDAGSATDVARPVLERRGIITAEMQVPLVASQAQERFHIVRKGSGPITRGALERFAGQAGLRPGCCKPRFADRWSDRQLRGRSANCLAPPRSWLDADRYGRMRLGSARGRSGGENLCR